MLQRDFIMRMLQAFFNDLDALFRGKRRSEEDLSKSLEGLYVQYLKKDRDYFHDLSSDALIDLFKSDADGVSKAEMLAALLHREGLAFEQKNMAEKSLALYRYIDSVSKDFSPTRMQAISEIESFLSE